MKLSVIIVNYNVCQLLEHCLSSVYAALQNISSQVIVVDNNSNDNSVGMIHEKFPHVILIENKTNNGFSIANNQALKIAKGEYVLLLNPDTVIEPDTFSKTIKFMDLHPEAGALGVKMINGDGVFLPESKRGLPTPLVAFYKMIGLSSLFPKSPVFNKYHLGYLNKNEIHQVDILAGAFMFIRKKVLDKIGLLDEVFFMYGEDIDLSYRILLSGYKNYYFPNTSIIHYKGQSSSKNKNIAQRHFYKAMELFYKKHFTKQNFKIGALIIIVSIRSIYWLSVVKGYLKRLI